VSQTVLKQMASLLMLKGESAEQAAAKVSQTNYAKSNQLIIEGLQAKEDFSLQALSNRFSGLKSVLENFKSIFNDEENYSQAYADLTNRQNLLQTGWEVYKGMRWMSWIYLVILSTIVMILNNFVAPQFMDVFASFGAELPTLTQLYFGDGFATTILIFLWGTSIAYMLVVSQIKKSIKTFNRVPAWMSYIPAMGAIVRIINQCISLMTYRFLTSFDLFKMPERENWHQSFGLSEKDKHYQWADKIYPYLTMASELEVLDSYLDKELDGLLDDYVSKTAQSMKIISVVSTLILSGLIASIVIAMYLPIFQMGSII